MAASQSSDHLVENTSEEINSIMDTPESAVSSLKERQETEKKSEVEEGTNELFKKPGIFVAPSLSTKRTVTVPSKSPAPSEAGGVREDNKQANVETEVKSDTQKKRTEIENDSNKGTDYLQKKPDVIPKVSPKGAPPGKFPPLPYIEPSWGGVAPDIPYTIEILKNGSIVNTIPLKDKSFFVVGRLPLCDVSLEHPSISRYHAIIQYRGESGETDSVGEESGFYVHDLGSTHGTVVNKNRIPPKTYIRLKVGHVLKFGGSTRLFILQGPEFDEEAESEFTVTELKERARKQREELEKRMMGAGSDDDEELQQEEGEEHQNKKSNEDSGCSWGMADDAIAGDENEENPFSTEFQEDQEAAYLKDPRKALQGFYDREGEELEFEYEEKGSGTWLCRIKLPVDDALGKQLVAEVTNTGKKKEVMVQCCLEACRMLEARGLLRQEAVSRKRKKKNWEDEDYYDSDDDTFLDRTGTVERKRKERMRKAGKIEERPETYESLVAKLAGVEKELSETQKKLDACMKESSGSMAEDTLDAFMISVRSEAAMDGVERRKLHVHVADLKKETQRLRRLVELTRPLQLPSLLPSGSSEAEKTKKSLPLFGAMKGGSKFKLKTGTIGKLPPKRPNLPSELFNMKDASAEGEEDDDDEEDADKFKMEVRDEDKDCENTVEHETKTSTSVTKKAAEEDRQASPKQPNPKDRPNQQKDLEHTNSETKGHKSPKNKDSSSAPTGTESKSEDKEERAENVSSKKKKRIGPSRPPVPLTGGQYPDDDPDYCVWVPPVGQSGDGRTHLNDKYGY